MDRLSINARHPGVFPQASRESVLHAGRDEHDDEGAASISESGSRANLEGSSR